MNVLVVGSGGREHSLVWKIRQSPKVANVICAPGNAGIEEIAKCVDVSPSDTEGLLRLAKEEQVGLTVVGPELPLTLGVADAFAAEGHRVFGPTRDAVQLEASKSFAKELMKQKGIPTAFFSTFTDSEEAMRYIREVGAPIVVKADGLCGGKGVMVCRTVEEALDAVNLIMINESFGDAGRKIVVEECLQGEEASFMVLTDGERVLPLPSAQDHKAVFDQDRGPNTGGMGAYSPAPVVTETVEKQVLEEIIGPTIEAMAELGRPYRGVLYAGLMIDEGKAKVLEFNCRFGDPEAQPVLMRLKGDIVPIMEEVAEGRLSAPGLDWDPRAAVCVVMASKGYPRSYKNGFPISGLEKVKELSDTVVFHAGTRRNREQIITHGGRVLGVTALGETIGEAISRTYDAVERIEWKGVHYRKDIGRKALDRRPRSGA
ncbi:MAG: phosphoribosylamine--glycine ligase [bacterium]